MPKTNNKIRLAVQKKGRLTNQSLEFLKSSGLEFEIWKKRLFSLCQNFPLEILYARDNDICDYTAAGTVDLGIVGQNLLCEQRPKVKKLLNLRFGFCSLVIAVPQKSKIKNISELNGLRVASCYPNSAKSFFKKNNLSCRLVKISGSVEAAPVLNIADAIADLVSTGSTLALNDLKILQKIYDSEAVLIANPQAVNNPKKQKKIEKLLTRFKGVLSAKNYKYVMMSAPEKILPKLKKIIPGTKSPAVSSLAKNGWISIQSVIKEDVFWQTAERLKKLGVQQITVLPIEKIIL